MELSGEQLVMVEIQMRRYLPQSQLVYGCLVLRNRVTSDPRRVLVDQWPKFRIIICQPLHIQKGEFFKDTVFFATHEVILRETLRKSTVFDWSKFLCLGCDICHMETVKAVALEKDVSFRQDKCHMMMMEDISKLPSLDSTGVLLGSLDESHIGLINQTWKYSQAENYVGMIRDMITNFPSCCVLDAKKQAMAWILTYATCAVGMLYTLPEHRGKGYAKVLVRTMAKRLHAQGYPVYCFWWRRTWLPTGSSKTWASLKIPQTGQPGLKSTFDVEACLDSIICVVQFDSGQHYGFIGEIKVINKIDTLL